MNNTTASPTTASKAIVSDSTETLLVESEQAGDQGVSSATNGVARIAPSPSLDTCTAVIIALKCRKYVVVYQDRPIRILPIDQICRSIRSLRPGDQVHYQGRTETVQALAVY